MAALISRANNQTRFYNFESVHDSGRDGPSTSWTVRLMDRPPHGRIRTSDHNNFPQMDKGRRSDGWTVHLVDGFGGQKIVICHRRTGVDGGHDGRSVTDPPPHARNRTTDHTKYSNVDGGERSDRTKVRRGLVLVPTGFGPVLVLGPLLRSNQGERIRLCFGLN